MDNIILTGFMGCGKTTVGVRLSYRLRRVVVDTDRWIEKELGRSIGEIFAGEGEGFFRDLETACLRQLLAEPDGRIISTGGGLPLREENRRLLNQLGTVVYLRAAPETVYERLKDDKSRPLLRGEEPLLRITGLMRERAPYYEAAADAVVDVDGADMEEILNRVLASCGALPGREGPAAQAAQTRRGTEGEKKR